MRVHGRLVRTYPPDFELPYALAVEPLPDVGPLYQHVIVKVQELQLQEEVGWGPRRVRVRVRVHRHVIVEVQELQLQE